MILILHNIEKVIEVKDILSDVKIDDGNNLSINETLLKIAELFPERLILWSNILVEGYINFNQLECIFHHDKIIASYNSSNNYAIPDSIGYVEQSPFLNVKKDVCYPTWLMSSTIGGAKGILISKFDKILNLNEPVPLVLNHLGKTAQKLGVFCYSDPRLLLDSAPIIVESQTNLFSFVNQHYKRQWLFLLMLNLFIYEKKFPFYKFLQGFSKRKFDVSKINLNDVKNVQSKLKVDKFSIDVVIPTMGRKKFLKNVLLDLANQTLLPNKVIIIEQTIDEISELNFLEGNWPFKIKHLCISTFGACHARNLGLKNLKNDFVFFADDDICIPKDFIKKAFDQFEILGAEALTFSCLQKGEVEIHFKVVQWISFGSGCSIVKSSRLKGLKFDEAYEFGYGEDFDFGMQLRNIGVDILYVPYVKLLHLKAPIGGFRKKIKRIWEKDQILPKPSPSVMVSKLKHSTNFQLLGYKTNLFIKFYKDQKTRNPFRYFKMMETKWLRSKYWAHKLINREV